MPELIARTPLQGVDPLELAGCRLSEWLPGPITSVAPLRGLDGALKKLGLRFPQPGEVVEGRDCRLVWTGRAQAFLIGAAAEGLASHAALTDQSDGWAGLALEGLGAEAVLARIVPVDLRLSAFPAGRAARVPFNHMSSVLIRAAEARFELLVFRSMARTAWHEVETAMAMLAARARVAP